MTIFGYQHGRDASVCAQVGRHAEPDRRGRCFMCGEQIVTRTEHNVVISARTKERVDRTAFIDWAEGRLTEQRRSYGVRATLEWPRIRFEDVIERVDREIAEIPEAVEAKRVNVEAMERGVGPGLHFPAIAEWLTDERKAYVREIRMAGCSLRAAASATYERFGGGPWWPDYNQLAGMDLCELAGVGDDSPEIEQRWKELFPEHDDA